MNSRERERWILNDEGLYKWFKSEGCSMTLFIRENKVSIDAVIAGILGKGPSA